MKIKSFDEDSKIFCRACFNDVAQTNKPKNLFDITIDDVYLSYIYTECTSIEIFRDDGLPSIICEPCETLLLSAYEFRTKCINGDQKYRKSLTEANQADIKPVVIWMPGHNSNEQSNKDVQEEPTESVGLLDIGCIKSESNNNSKITFKPEENDFLSNPTVKLKISVEQQNYTKRCEHCTRRFTTNFNLNRHLRQIHKVMPSKTMTKLKTKKKAANSLAKQQKIKKHRKIKRESSMTEEIDPKQNEQNQLQIFTEQQQNCKVEKELSNIEINFKQEEHQCDVEQNDQEKYICTKQGKYTEQCEHCNRCFTTNFNLIRHLRTQHKIHKSAKKQRKSEYNTKQKTVTKSSNKHASRTFSCFVCKKTFKNLITFREHVPIEHASYVTNDKQFKCSYCPKIFPQWNKLEMHIKLHAGAKFKCSFCNLTFGYRYEFNDHMIDKHDGARIFACLNCDEKFHSNSALHQHYRLHTDKMSFLCQECGKSFMTTQSLHSHMQIHLNKDRFACDKCPMKFAFKGRLRAHYVTHSTDKPFECDLCGKTTSRKYVMETHMFVHTGKRLLRFPCDICNKKFKAKYHLVEHIRTHTGEKPFKCTYCIKAYAQKADLNKHLRVHVGENTYECDECLERFRLKKELDNHKSDHYTEKIASNKIIPINCMQ